MNATDRNHADNLRNALQELHHSGPSGFEGLLSILLGQLTGQTFRLASSGTQRGRDGDSAFDGGATYFEGKRYQTSPDKKEIAGKLYDLAIDETGQVDLWVLGATCEVSAQVVRDAQAFAAKHGIGIVALDWSDNDLGALLLATVAAGAAAKTFIEAGLLKTGNSHLTADALAAIDHFAVHPNFETRLASLRQAVSIEEVGMGQARAFNRTWMERLFASRVLARAEFGQPLAPLDTAGLVAVARPQPSSLLLSAFTGRPQSEFYAVTGDEGVGKSWICANTWLEAVPRSILVICPADDLLGSDARVDFESYLIKLLIRQTGGQSSERAIHRWRRRFKGWRANPTPDNVRVTLLIDGLNQPRDADWPKWLDRAALELQAIGGCIVATTRLTHWKQLRQLLASNVTSVPVAVWSIPEVKSLLSSRGIDPENVSAAVLVSLQNPRLLGIAVDLMEAKDVELIGQLSVGRLIFEHMRKAQTTGTAAMSGIEFAELLKGLGDEVLRRIQKQEADDLRVFDSATKDDLHAVATTRFFAPVQGAPLQYEIKPEGLNLGLALSLISALEKEHRNNRDPRDRLGTILEPISALDEAATVVFLAIQIACLEDTSEEVKTALIEHFVSLQNLPNSEADSFALLVKASPSAFLTATENVNCSARHYQNIGWLFYALRKHRDDAAVWPAIAEQIKRWLSIYSLAPERMMFKTAGRDPADEVAEEWATRNQKLAEAVANLTGEEQAFVADNLVANDRWDFDTLFKTAFHLLAGRPLKEFASYFIRWSFSDAYGPALHAADKDFRQLIRFNRIDWPQTRSALLRELTQLPGNKTSNTGKWARVEILIATGAVDDANEADKLAEWLTRDRERFPGWSLLEQYCAADPCNPDSAKPENVDKTAQDYCSIDPSKLAIHMGHGQEDHFFNMARCGVVRFNEAAAQTAHRAFINDVATRSGFGRRQGVIQLLEHSSLITDEQAKHFLAAGQSSNASYKDGQGDGKDEWLTAQYSIRLATPHLAPDDQLDAISNIRGENVLLDTLEAIYPASEAKVEQILEKVLQGGHTNAQSAVLGAVQYSKPTLSARALRIVAALCQSSNVAVRAQALGVASSSSDSAILKEIVDSGWGAGALTSVESAFERWHGSGAILAAAKAGHLAIESALDRMHLDHYGFAARKLGSDGALAVLDRVDVAILKALAYTQKDSLPEIVTTTPTSMDPGPPMVSLSTPPPQERQSNWHRLDETTTQFYERQKRAGEAFEKFSAELNSANATLILSDLTLDGVRALVEVSPESGRRWLSLLMVANDVQLSHLHHVAFQIAIALSAVNTADASALIDRLARLKPTVRRNEGLSKLPTEAILLWANADVPSIESFCKRRLTTCHRDSDISTEVLAAYFSGKGRVVGQVVDELLDKGEPADICLALTLAGYSDTGHHAASVIARFEGVPGFIGTAQSAAKYAYERNAWSRRWYRQMVEAEDKETFWRASVLLTKIVDGRFDLWSRTLGSGGGTVFTAFRSTIKAEVKSRIEKWQNKRKDKLFGDKVPADVFLPS